MSIENVRAYFAQFGRADDILEFTTSSATVQLAAEAVGTIPARIAKTLSFQGADDTALLIVCARRRQDRQQQIQSRLRFQS